MKADGTGSFRAAKEFTGKAAAVIWRLKASDPDGDFAKDIERSIFHAPDEAAAKALAEKGIKVTESAFKMDEKSLASKIGVDFRRIEAFRHLAAMPGVLAEGQGMVLTLTREKEGGVYALAVRVSGDGAGFDAGDAAGDADGDPDAEADPAEAEKRKLARSLMDELAREAGAFKARFAIEVPGTVVDFRPTTSGRAEEGRVAWEFDLKGLATIVRESVQQALSEGGGSPTGPGSLVLSVRFKPAEGVAIPDDALWSGPPKPAAGTAPTDGKAPGEPKPLGPETAPAPAPTPPKDE